MRISSRDSSVPLAENPVGTYKIMHKLSLMGYGFYWSEVGLMDSLSGSILFFFHKGSCLLIGFLCGVSFLTLLPFFSIEILL